MTANPWQYDTPGTFNMPITSNMGTGGAAGDYGAALSAWNGNGGADSVMGSGAAANTGTQTGTSFLEGLGGFNALFSGLESGWNIYSGKKKLDLFKDQLDFQKKAWEKNYKNQKTLTNARLEDRQRRRYYENPDYYRSPGEYMKKNGVK